MAPNASRKAAAASKVDDGQPLADAEVEAIADDSDQEQDALAKSGLSKEDFRARRTQAYSAGTKRLREENREEFQRIVKEEGEKLGIDYVFSLTPEEKAAEQIKALLAAHPSLAETIGK